MQCCWVTDVLAASAELAGITADVDLTVWLPAESRLAESFWTAQPRLPLADSHEYSFYGQDEEDRYAFETFFRNTTGGTYLEIGALDGVALSNTLFFARQKGWKGILIEPGKDMYQHLVKNRASDVCVNAAICPKSTSLHYVEDYAVGGIIEFMSDDFRKQHHAGVNITDLPVLPCVPLSLLFTKLGVQQIDFFSLDVEGAELQVLSTIDYSSTQIGVLVVEADATSTAKDKAVRELLSAEGFKLHAHITRNDWFVHKSYSHHSS